MIAYPYCDPTCVRYGITMRFKFSCSANISPFSSFRTTNSNLQSLSVGKPNRPHTAGRSGLQIKLKSFGKNESYTSKGV